ncbi:DNA ligase [Paenibacillus sp. 481]|uniref:DNA ligase n=1 Tax=Paenibacillus sp. 481 TaxID=2835869 RepID=UPI001E42CA51|nr:DNA ligase [Paenibacillus sp. 481]UHA75780.1 DNA ligase [Paenibacillus sp. 481]
MIVNITNLVRGLIGEASPGETRALELKTGQVVRGVVMNVAENGREATVNINGVPVRATLETPLTPGQTTWMQVQGQQADGVVILKPTDGAGMASSQTVGDTLKQAGLPNEPWARSLIMDLQRAGVPMTKELTNKLAQAFAMKPPNVAADEWMQAASVAVRRQLPLTGETVRGLHQAMFGKQLHELLANFQRVSDTVLGADGNGGRTGAGVGGGGAPWSGALRDAQALVRTLLTLIPGSAGASGSQQGSAAGNGVAGHFNSSAAGAGQNGVGTGSAGGGANSGTVAVASHAAQANGSAVGQGSLGTGSTGMSGSAPSSATGVSAGDVSASSNRAAPHSASHLNQSSQAATAKSAASGVASAQVAAGDSIKAGAGSGPASNGSLVGAGNANTAHAGQASGNAADSALRAADGSAARAQGSAGSGSGAWLGRMLTLLGVTHEQQVHRMPLTQQQTASAAGSASAMAAQSNSAPATAGGSNVAAGTFASMPAQMMADASLPQAATAQLSAASAGAAQADSLKSALLQLMQSENVPPALREAAQQLVQQVTGQQLLLASDRQSQFAHVTMFVPLMTPDGKQTAAVHIQSRQGRRGELDANNCRLWFDLDMKAMGRTLVDVQVVDRAVALNIHHPNPELGDWLISFRDEIDAAIETVGYKLSAFRALPPPEQNEVESESPSARFNADDYALKPYRGVDMRV